MLEVPQDRLGRLLIAPSALIGVAREQLGFRDPVFQGLTLRLQLIESILEPGDALIGLLTHTRPRGGSLFGPWGCRDDLT